LEYHPLRRHGFLFIGFILKNLSPTSLRREVGKIKSHPHNAAKEISSGTIKKVVMGRAVKDVNQKKTIRTHDVTTTEARAEKSMPLTEIKMVLEARRDKVVVTAR
jgi:hypothetical protein